MGATHNYDFDWLVIGSGFGGSVSALRLAEKGHSRRRAGVRAALRDHDSPSTTADLKRYFWLPLLGMKGSAADRVQGLFVVSGCGVGGGSLGYANTLYVPPGVLRGSPVGGMDRLGDRARAPLRRGAADARRRRRPDDDPADQLLRELGEELGVGDTFKKTPVGVFFGEPGKTVADPYFGGEGPERTGCPLCGRCMVGCRHGAKNTLVKNYLYFAEKRGVRVMPERTVVDIRPLGDGRRRDGYEVEACARARGCARTAACTARAVSSSRPGRSAPTSCCSAAA